MRTRFGRVVHRVLGIWALALVSAQLTSGIAASADGTVSEGIRASTRSPAMLWGAYVPGGITQTAQFEAMVGRKMNLQAVFVSWDGNNSAFPAQYAPVIRDAGKTMVIFWEVIGSSLAVDQPQYNNDSIIRGSWDKYIASFAAAAKLYRGPIILIPMPEMNGNWYSWCGTVNGNSAAKFIAAWRHIHGFFEGVSNVKFGWAVNSNSVPDTKANAIPAYYPGAAYVDYVGVDGFNYAGNPWPWASFKEIFSAALDQLRAYGKPIYIFSMASAQAPKKSEWILDALGRVYLHPLVWRGYNVKKKLEPRRVA